jgi:Spy/CpxP family protein refolding chaperone
MKKAIVIVSALVLLTQGTAMAGRAGRDRRIDREMMGYGKGYDCFSLTTNAKLNLTVDQAARIRDLDEKYAQEIEPIREQLYGKGRELKKEWLQTEPDRSRIKALHGEVAKLRERMREKMAGHRADVLKVLTPEQQAKVPDVSPGRGFHRQAGFGRQ